MRPGALAALLESGNGTERTNRAGLAMSVDWGRPEVDSLLPERRL
jgi:hypothetical protein